MAATFSGLSLPAVLITLASIISSLSLLKTCGCQEINPKAFEVAESPQNDDQSGLVFQTLNISHPSPPNHRKLSNDHPHHLNIRHPHPWVTGVVTWYGSPEGAGSDGGACGYKSAVLEPPIDSMITAGSNAIYLSGKGCGGCYKVKCTPEDNKLCSGTPIKVVLTDKAPEDSSGQVHFDLSGTAFGALAHPGQAAELRTAGTFPIQYKRVSCGFKRPLTFKVDAGTNPFYVAILVQLQNGRRDISCVELKEKDTNEWKPMTHSWGAIYQYNSVTGKPLCFPLSVRVTQASGQAVIADDVIPAGWDSSTGYAARGNF